MYSVVTSVSFSSNQTNLEKIWKKSKVQCIVIFFFIPRISTLKTSCTGLAAGSESGWLLEKCTGRNTGKYCSTVWATVWFCIILESNKGSSRDALKMWIKTYKHQEHQEPSYPKVASVLTFSVQPFIISINFSYHSPAVKVVFWHLQNESAI